MALLFNSPEISTAKILFNPNPRNLKSLSVRVGARSDVKDCEVRLSGLNQNVRLYGQFSAPVKPGLNQNVRLYGQFSAPVKPGLNQNVRLYGQFSAPVKPETKRTKEEEEKQNYYVNMGYAIRSLREEFRELFYRELSFDIYRDDIVFKDPINTFSGIEKYKSIFWALRIHGRIFFRALWVDIISVSQPAENVIMVRWTVHGIPRVPWESHARFDGLSEYKLDSKGKIFQHRVDNIAHNSSPRFHVLAVEELIQSVGCPSTPKPTFFEVSTSFLKNN